jgi:hypothetical protein
VKEVRADILKSMEYERLGYAAEREAKKLEAERKVVIFY